MLGSFVRATSKGTKDSSSKSKMSNKSHPDADLFPHATGLAQKTVEEHQAEQPLKLYAGWFCPFVGRAWTVLQEKNIPYQYIEVSGHFPRMVNQG
jgi:hypothetical protein